MKTNGLHHLREYPEVIGLERPLFGHVARYLFGLSSEDLAGCLKQQRQRGGRLGEILRQRNLLGHGQVAKILKVQARWTARAHRGDLDSQHFPYPCSFSLCLPAYNEESNIGDTLDAACAILPEFVKDFEVVVVDDGSRDATAAIVTQHGRENSKVKLVQHPQNRGYGAAVRSGLQTARGNLIAFTDSDGQFNLLDLPQLLAHVHKHDVVIGYRHQRADNSMRSLNAWAWNCLVRMFLGLRVRDLDCAFKLFRREVLEQLELTSTGAAINAEIMMQTVQMGAQICELPVNHFPRYHGKPTGANLKVIAKAFQELPRLREIRRRTFKPAGSTAAGSGLISARGTSSLKICMLAACPFPANHGTAGSIREMAEAMADQGLEIHVVTYHYGEGIPVNGPYVHRITRLVREGAVMVGPTLRKPLYDLQMVFKALKVIRQHKPDLLHAHGYEGALVAWICRLVTGLPVVFSGHHTMTDELPSYGFLRPQWLARAAAGLLDAAVPRLADRCIPHSANMEQFFRQRRSPEYVNSIVNFGIDVDWIAGGDGLPVREQYGLGSAPVILYTGVLDHFQQFELLLKAMVPVAWQCPSVKLLVVPPLAQENHVARVRRQAQELGIVDHLVLTDPQPLSALRNLLQSGDIAVIPRPNAPGFPIKLLNYMAAQKPCVLFASSASIGLEHRKNAFLVSPDTPQALGEAILELLADPALCHKMAHSGHQFVRRHHDRRRIAAQIGECYRRVLELQAPFHLPPPATTEARGHLPTHHGGQLLSVLIFQATWAWAVSCPFITGNSCCPC
jgi:1,2-diacylglycerol 3-alpha-glucosyltransferase